VRAIDTNIVVRLLTADDAEQAKAARGLVEAGDIFLGVTVLLEAEWVLRAGYGFAPAQIVAALRGMGWACPAPTSACLPPSEKEKEDAARAAPS